MTTSANVELVRSIYAAWERGDFSSAEWAHPEIEYVIAEGPSPGTWTGVAGMAGATRDWLNAWEDLRFMADEYRELDRERVLVLDRRSGRGKTSGMDLGQMRATGAHLFQIRGGKVRRLVAYNHLDRALADLGLAPEAKTHSKGHGASRETPLLSKLEIVRRAEDAIERRDVEALEALMAPGCEIVPTSTALDSKVHHGPDAVANWFASQDETMEGISSEIETFQEGPDWVLIVGRLRARGRSSSVPLDVQGAAIWRFREGRIAGIRVYTDRDRALADLGLGPEAGSSRE